MKKILLVATACGLLASSCSAFAGCTSEEMDKKMADLRTARAAYEQRHPDKAGELEAKFEDIIRRHPPNIFMPHQMCKGLDEMIAAARQ